MMIRAFVWSVSVIISITAMILFFSLPSRAQPIAPIAPVVPIAPVAPIFPIAPIAPIYPFSPAMFPVQAQVFSAPWGVRVAIANTSYYPFVCQGQLAAVSAWMGPHWLNFVTPPVFPGNWGHVDLRPNFGDAFLNGTAYVYCWY